MPIYIPALLNALIIVISSLCIVEETQCNPANKNPYVDCVTIHTTNLCLVSASLIQVIAAAWAYKFAGHLRPKTQALLLSLLFVVAIDTVKDDERLAKEEEEYRALQERNMAIREAELELETKKYETKPGYEIVTCAGDP